MPKVTILLPVFNCEKYVSQAIESILNQSFTDFEFLIINDGSTDSTPEILKEFSDSRIKIINNLSNEGLVPTLNRGITLANGEYIFRMDSDDVSHRERIKRQVQFMEINPKVVVCGTNRFILGRENSKGGKALKNSDVLAISIFNCPLVHPSVCIRKRFLDEYQLRYNVKYIHSEDNALWLAILKIGGEISVLSERLVGYRLHDDQVSKRFAEKQKESSTKARVDFLNYSFGIRMNVSEIKLYRALSYKEEIENIDMLQVIPSFVEKLNSIILNNGTLIIDRDVFLKILYERLSLLYLKSSFMGLTLVAHYLTHFLFNKNIYIGFKLLRRVFLKI
ncbi:glycosyltransferase family 2 protein [Belliella kenyensis]|uniref:Glycosyltransferase family 2 protein n=1 Tax=Belliella kenyensis TaxID=1472724 RepID=A0ABV8EQ48_9BACT|nr:glycosyltransferase family 2 protein [Belliella kenyensis]MCH7402096.1 glycosyltransferase family 2 protein [Belliella kenyensis]MDN3601538.1 glycosyltransferase family 2 protein [Belliella kenyensis]